MGLFATYCGLLWIASIYDIKNRRVPALLVLILMLAPPLFLYWSGNLAFNLQVLISFLFTFILVFSGHILFGFGGADGKILLGLSFLFPVDIMALFIFITFAIFTLYFTVFFRKQNEAPLVPAITITATGLMLVTSL